MAALRALLVLSLSAIAEVANADFSWSTVTDQSNPQTGDVRPLPAFALSFRFNALSFTPTYCVCS
jgi:hypothetical protein